MKLTVEDGKRSLRDHAMDKARQARSRYDDPRAPATLAAMLADREVVRFPVRLVFDAAALRPGEFAHAERIGAQPGDGYVLYVHPDLQHCPDDLPLAVAYHLVCVNYGDMADAEDAEWFGATLLGLDRDVYYEKLCIIADRLTPPKAAGSSVMHGAGEGSKGVRE